MKLAIEEVLRRAPSIGAPHPHHRVSSKYTQVKTIDIIDQLASQGWHVSAAKEQLVRDSSRNGFQKHVVHFRHRDCDPSFVHAPHEHKIEKGKEIFEIVMINSHDRSSAWVMHGGIFVQVCSNGLIISKSTFAECRITHTNISMGEILAYASLAADNGDKMISLIDDMKEIDLPHHRRLDFANAALMAKYDNVERSPVSPEVILEPRREEDQGISLWKTYQVVQENLIRALQRDPQRVDQFGRKMGPSNPVVSIDRNITLNQQLWDLAVGFMNN